VQWAPLFEESDDDQAATNLKRAQIAQTLTPVGGDPRTLVEITDEGEVLLLPQTPEEAQQREEELLAEPEPLPGEEVPPAEEAEEEAETQDDPGAAENESENADASLRVIIEGNPYRVIKRGSKFCVIKKDSGATVKCHATRGEALAHFRALEANVEDA
jgi:hypothetical protein